MSLSDSQITGARRDLHLGKETYVASPLTDRDLTELDSWLRGQVIQIAITSIPDDCPREVREEIINAAVKSAPSVTMRSSRGMEALETPEGVCRLIWQMVHKNHPDATPSDFMRYMRDDISLRNVFLVFNELNGSEEKPSGNEEEGV